MSPSPDRFHQPSKYPLPNQPHANEQPSAASNSSTGAPAENSSDQSSGESTASEVPETTPLVPKRPLMRPVSRPQPSVQAAPVQASPQVTSVQPSMPKAAPSETVVPAVTSHTHAGVASSGADDAAAAQAMIRQQPIPPPSEPKQYRAIGLLRGRYTPSEEQFTRGSLVTSDGTEIEAVLLGRVMSLVRNHLDLEQEHLWVVYPRTREMKKDLHAQIVGVWEPEKLSKTESEDDSDSDSSEEISDDMTSPGFADDYFSIRGEIVFHAPEEDQIVVKIQQAPRKSSDKEKAFKLRLEGVLSGQKLLGYFWDLQVERRNTSLVITGGTSIGLVPPKKKSADSGPSREHRPFRKPRGDSRDSRPGGRPPRASGATAAPVRRDPPPKPVKRSEQSSES